MRDYVIAAIVAGSLAAPAMAQNAAPFTGLRAEGIIGYERAEVPGDDSSGVAYGAGVGYDFQAGGAVVGIEGEFSDSTVDKCVDNFVAAGDRICAKAGRDLYIGGRAGALVGPSTLLYAKAGYVNGRVKTDYDDGTAANAGSFRVAENLDGVRVGAGAEVAIGPNSFVKAEYRYSNYEQGYEKHQAVAGFGFRF